MRFEPVNLASALSPSLSGVGSKFRRLRRRKIWFCVNGVLLIDQGKLTLTNFIIANVASHRSELIELNVEYVSWVMSEFKREFGVSAEDIVGMSASEYVDTVIDKVCGDPLPVGIFYLIRVDNQLAGMGGLRCVRPGVAEIKRIYIRPAFRGMKLGERILGRLIEDARNFGYEGVCLESGPFMKSAHRLYERYGFTDCPVYEGVEVPPAFHDRWRFMQLSL